MITILTNSSTWLYLLGCLSLLGCVLLYVDRWWQCRQRIRNLPGLLGYAAAQHWAAYLETRGYLLLFSERLVYETPHGQSIEIERSSIRAISVQQSFNGRREWMWGARHWLVVTCEDGGEAPQIAWLIAPTDAVNMAEALREITPVGVRSG